MSKPIPPSPFEEQIVAEPDLFPWTEGVMRALWDNPWTDKKWTFSADVQDYKVNMDEQVRVMFTRCLSAISQVEIAAVKDFWADIKKLFPRPSIAALGHVLANNEVIHYYAYRRALKELSMFHLYEENMNVPCIKNRIKYLKKHLSKQFKDPRKQAVFKVVLFSLYVENVSLFSQFYTINYLNSKRNMVKDTAQQVLYTAKEETLHALTGMRLVNDAKAAHPEIWDDEMKEKIVRGCRESRDSEVEIIKWQLNGYESEFVSVPILTALIEDRFNTSLKQIGIDPVFEVDEELLAKTEWFTEEVLGTMKTDFFDSTPVEYSEVQAEDEDDWFSDQA